MKSIGQILREERLRQGLALEQVSALTRISLKNLTAIEADDFSYLPGGFFYKSFVHQYADVLKLDFNNLSQALQSIAENIPAPAVPGRDGRTLPKVAPLVARESSGYRWVYTMGLFLVVLAGCSGLYAWWKSSAVSGEPEVVLSESTNSPTPASPTSPDRSSDTSQPSSSTAPSSEPSAAAEQPQATPKQTQELPDQAHQTTPATSDMDSAFRIRIAALEQTWLSLTSDGKQVFSGVMQPDETRVLEGHQRAKMKVGNAGGLAITFNGREIGALGPRGQVRTVVFTKDNFEVVHPGVGAEEASLIPSANRRPAADSLSSFQSLLLPLER